MSFVFVFGNLATKTRIYNEEDVSIMGVCKFCTIPLNGCRRTVSSTLYSPQMFGGLMALA